MGSAAFAVGFIPRVTIPSQVSWVDEPAGPCADVAAYLRASASTAPS
jgi:hypothetical protein